MSKWFHMLTLVGMLLPGLVACSPEQEQTTPMAAPYEFEASYVWLSRDDMIAQADSIFVGRVVSFSPARWNQDSGEDWKGVGANLPYHEITATVEQPIVDAIGLGEQATITVLGGSPAGSIQSGSVVIADKPEHTLRAGDQAVFFLRLADLAWRPGPDMQEASRPVTMFLGAPNVSYLTLEEDGLYHSQAPEEPPQTLDALVTKIKTMRQ